MWKFSWPDFVVVQVMDGMFVFCLNTLSVHVQRAGGRPGGMPQGGEELYFK